MLLRISLGVSLLFVGLNHYMTMDGFTGMVSGGLGPLTPLGTIWAYVLPGLMVVGGALLALGMYMDIGSWAAGIALASIPMGLLLKSVVGGVPLTDVMPMVHTTFIWILVYYFAVKSCCCCGSCSTQGK
jgi:uncharacterized membrane protein YphA (DoxX/SURF4 family)